MSQARALWRARWILLILGMAPSLGVGLTASVWWPFAACAFTQVIAVALTARLARQARYGDTGDILYIGGGRAELGAARSQIVGELVALAAAAVSAVVGILTVPEDSRLVLGFLTFALIAVYGLFAWSQLVGAVLLEAYVAHIRGAFERSRRLGEWGARVGPVTLRQLALRAAAQAQMASGEVDAAERQLRSLWDGTLEGAPSSLVLLQLRHGDTTLVHRWIEVQPEPDDPYSAFQLCHARALLALSQGHWDEAVAAASQRPSLPPHHRESLDVVVAAAHQGARRTTEAQAIVGRLRLGLQPYAYMARAYPFVWRPLAEAASSVGLQIPSLPPSTTPKVAPLPAVDDSPFAAPSAAPAPQSVAQTNRNATLGAVPVDWLAVSSLRYPRMLVVRALLGILGASAALVMVLLGFAVGDAWRVPEASGLLLGFAVFAILGGGCRPCGGS